MMRVAIVDMIGCTSIRESGSSSTTCRSAAGSVARGDDAVDRRRGVRAPRAAHRAARARLAARALHATTRPTPRRRRRRSTRCRSVPSGARRSAARLDALHRAEATLFLDQLTDGDRSRVGRAGTSRRARRPTTARPLDAHTAAVRGLFAAYLATGDVALPRSRARRVRAAGGRLLRRRARASTGPTPGARRAACTFTPLRFALLQARCATCTSSSRSLPGQRARSRRRSRTASRGSTSSCSTAGTIANGDQHRRLARRVRARRHGADGDPLRLGGLQMAERALTGEIGSARRREPMRGRARRHDRIASTTASPRSTTRTCRRRSRTRSRSTIAKAADDASRSLLARCASSRRLGVLAAVTRRRRATRRRGPLVELDRGEPRRRARSSSSTPTPTRVSIDRRAPRARSTHEVLARGRHPALDATTARSRRR